MAKHRLSAAARSALEKDAKARLLAAASLPPADALRQYAVSEAGHKAHEIERLRDATGANIVPRQKHDSALKRLMKAFINPFTAVLFVLAVISFVTDVMMAQPGSKDPSSVIIIVVMVALSGTLQFVQEAKSNKAAEKLGEMVKTTCAVRRDDVVAEIPIEEVVVGDIIILNAGDMVPADLRVLEAKDLFVAQSSLTGESEPAEKHPDARNTGGKDPLDMDNLAFMGTNIVSGSAAAMVVNVGAATIFGSIAHTLQQQKPPTSFEKGIRSVSFVLIRFMLVMVPVVFLLSGLGSGSWMDAFLFALSVAVGLTPAMLPTVVATGLAKGAAGLSKRKVIVKSLNSIQNFGAMDVLCTDKTGTLTQDKVALMYSLNVSGDEDEAVLQKAVLNSYYQTGLTNLMDIAVLDYAREHHESEAYKQYTKVDEVPFDFARRRMSVIVRDPDGKSEMITKGAIEEMLSVCGYVETDGRAERITKEHRDSILTKVQGYNADGLRVLGIAYKTGPETGAFSVEDEHDMTLIGYLAFLDPPKESSPAAIAALHAYGVDVKILTGDNDFVTKAVCRKVGIPVDKILLGEDIDARTDAALEALVEDVSVFAKLSPQQKARVVTALRRRGHTVGYMGDGINDTAAMRQADVGISVDTAVDIAKESANIILLDKDLLVLQQGIIDGRKTYANIIKYIKMTVSSNLGNMLSVLAASAFLPFLPMLPLQLLVLSLIYDISCIAIPWDNVDEDFLKIPRKWDASSLSRFMVWLGPTSSIFDICTYIGLYFWLCPLLCGGAYHTLAAGAQAQFATLFHTGWFVMSLWTQTLVIHMLRTPKAPFIQSRTSWQVSLFTSAGIAAGTLLPYTPIGAMLGMVALPGTYYLLLFAALLGYIALTTVVKKRYVRRYGGLL